MKKLISLFTAILLSVLLYSQSNSITNINVTPRNDGSGLMDVYFDLDGGGTNYFIKLEVSFNSGSTYTAVHSTYTSGDVGPINPGNGKHIVWNAMLSNPNTYSDVAKLKVSATTGTFPNTGEPCPGTPLVTYEGKTYHTILIGEQCWLKENLNVGSILQAGISQSNNGVIEKYCYNNEPINCDIYGGLYQWNEMMQYVTTPGSQGICPTGWHIPTDEEWKILEGNVDSQYDVGNTVWDVDGCRGYDAGMNLKSTVNWSNSNGTDYYGFSALPSGLNHTGYPFHYFNTRSFFWTSSESVNNYSYLRYIESNCINRTDRIYLNTITQSKNCGIPVRCLKN
jgi:uncharacterized protein (TIGR02145 family)